MPMDLAFRTDDDHVISPESAGSCRSPVVSTLPDLLVVEVGNGQPVGCCSYCSCFFSCFILAADFAAWQSIAV